MNERKYYTIQIRYSGGDPWYVYSSPNAPSRCMSTSWTPNKLLHEWPECLASSPIQAWSMFANFVRDLPMRGLSLTQVQLVEAVPTQTVRYEPVPR